MLLSNQGRLMSHVERKRIYFISDAHLGGSCLPFGNHTGHNLVHFLRSIRQDAEILYIVGDLFDFWFEYRSVVPSAGARVVFELYALTQAGVRVVYIPGNHDIWPGSYLSREVGLDVSQGPVTVSHQGLRIRIVHGDEHRRDWRFRLSRGILRNPVCIKLFRLLHPDLGTMLARRTSRLSDYQGRSCTQRGWEAFRDVARETLDGDIDTLVCGHYHRPLVEPMGKGTLVVLGDWITEDTFAVLEDGRMRIERWVCSEDP
jgi:UDP-2,3-diacylglucosamine hydrolase